MVKAADGPAQLAAKRQPHSVLSFLLNALFQWKHLFDQPGPFAPRAFETA